MDKQTMIFPHKLKPGDTVGLIAPSSHQTKENLTLVPEAISILESWGLQVRLQPGYDHQHFYLAGTDQHRSVQFQQFYTDPQIKALFVTRGGYGASRMLRYLDQTAIAASQKIVVGMSDATSLLLYLQKVCQMAVFHGPGLATTQFLKSPQRERTQQSLHNLLFSTDYHPTFPVQVLRHGTAKGRLTGGCLSLVVATLGTYYEIDTKGKILFLEDVNEAPFRIDRMLTHLQNAGKLDHLQGLIFGVMENCSGRDNVLWELLDDFFQDVSFPVAYGLPSGHGECCVTLSLGSQVELNTITETLHFLPLDGSK